MSVQYDLHIHTALSPCANDDMTPNNIVNMALLSGLEVIAITDHNTTANCAAVQKAAMDTQLTVICGMELCTSEEVHTVCLLPDIQSAWYFDRYVASKSMDLINRPDIFGRQLLMDEQDNIIGEEQRMLSTAANISITDLHHIINHYGGVAFPAHIDRPSNGIITMLGAVPEDCYFGAVEIKQMQDFMEKRGATDILARYNTLSSSDAHWLEAIKEDGEPLPVEPNFNSIAAYLTERV